MFEHQINQGETLVSAIMSTTKTEIGKAHTTAIGNVLTSTFNTFNKIRKDKTRSEAEQNHLILKNLKPKVADLDGLLVIAREQAALKAESIKNQMLNESGNKSEFMSYMMLKEIRDSKNPGKLIQSDKSFYKILSDAPAAMLNMSNRTKASTLESAAAYHFSDLNTERLNLFHTHNDSFSELGKMIGVLTKGIETIENSPAQATRFVPD